MNGGGGDVDENIDKSSTNALQNKELYNLIKRLYNCAKNNLNYDEYLDYIFYPDYLKIIYKDDNIIELCDKNNTLVKTINENELVDNVKDVLDLSIINESNISKNIDYLPQLTNLKYCEAFGNNIKLSSEESISLTNLSNLEFLAIHRPSSLINITCNTNLKFASVVNNVSDLSTAFDSTLIRFTNTPIKYYGISNNTTELIDLHNTTYENMFVDSNNFIFGNGSGNVTNIKNVILSHNVTTCNDYCFGNCVELSSIKLPNVTSCGYGCFFQCGSVLSSIKLPNVTSCGSYCFNNCYGLTSIELPNVTICNSYCFRYCTKLPLINLPNVITFGTSCFLNCKNLSEIILSSKVSTIGSNCFQGCKFDIQFKINTTDLTKAQYIKSLIANSGNLPSNPSYWYKDAFNNWTEIP